MPDRFDILTQAVDHWNQRLNIIIISILLHDLDLEIAEFWTQSLLDHSKALHKISFCVGLVPFNVTIVI